MPRSSRAAIAATLALSIPLIVLPGLGPLLAAWIGGRRARSGAIAGGVVAALIWGAVLAWLSTLEVQIGSTKAGLGPLSLLIPVQCGGFIAGGLFAFGARPAVSVGLVALVAGALWTGNDLRPLFNLLDQFRPAPAPQQSAQGSCEERLKRLYTAALMYSDSWDQMLPPADRWEEALKETLSDAASLDCPALGTGKHGYAMNSEVGGKRVSEIADAAGTPLFYDSTLPPPNAHDNVASLPQPGRHDGRNYIVYLDGSVRARP